MGLGQSQKGFATVNSRHEAPFCSQTSALVTAVCRQTWGIPTLTPANPGGGEEGTGSSELVQHRILGLSKGNCLSKDVTRPSWVPGQQRGVFLCAFVDR